MNGANNHVNQMILKIIRNLKKLFLFTINFNPSIAIKLIVIQHFYPLISMKKRFTYKHSIIKNYLQKKFKKIINEYKDKQNNTERYFSDNYEIWSIWWQGEDQMPVLVKTCFETLKKNSNGHKVNLITKNNFHHFVDLPDYILKKAKNGRISITHLSDVLRICLLYEYGGLWLDSTVFLTAPLQPLPPICYNLGFWTPKDDSNILESCFGARNWIVREDKWLTFCFYLGKHNILGDFVKTMFFSYLKKKSLFIDYFLFDYFISIAYDIFPEVKKMIDSVPKNNPRVHELYHGLNLNNEYNKNSFDEILSDTSFHKLNWKENFYEYTEDGKMTNYGFLISNFP